MTVGPALDESRTALPNRKLAKGREMPSMVASRAQRSSREIHGQLAKAELLKGLEASLAGEFLVLWRLDLPQSKEVPLDLLLVV